MISDLFIRNPSRYGWIPDLPDVRDFLYSLKVGPIPALPPLADLRNQCSPVSDQGQLGSCTAFALVGNLEFLKLRKLSSLINFSQLFLYYNERLIRNSADTDSGASLRDGIKSLVKAGDCLSGLWPYDISQFAVKPSDDAYKNALDYQILSYYRIVSTAEMKHTISTGFPFVFGFAVYDSFESALVAQTGVVPMPQPSERVIGGHAVMAVGYDDAKGYFTVRNSWGEGWGDHGYFYMPYAYLENKYLATDFWTVRDME